MGTLAMLSLGSNLGDRRAHLDAAVSQLATVADITLHRVSSFHETAPVGGPSGQGAYLNAAAVIETSLDPLDLLLVLQMIERSEERVRTERWGERTLDIDLLLYGSLIIDTGPQCNRIIGGVSTLLRVPHPRMAVRRFVLAPLAEIAPETVDPLTGRTVRSLLANLDRRPSMVALHLPDDGNEISPVRIAFETRMNSGIPESWLGTPLFLNLVEDLKPFPIRFEHTEPVVEPSAPSDPEILSRLESDLYQRLERYTRALKAALREAGERDNSWVLVSYWFDLFAARATSVIPLDRWPSFQDCFCALRSHVLKPTFIVSSFQGARSLRVGAFPDARHWFPPLGDVPVLELPPTRIDGLGRPYYDLQSASAEVVAACQATRPA